MWSAMNTTIASAEMRCHSHAHIPSGVLARRCGSCSPQRRCLRYWTGFVSSIRSAPGLEIFLALGERLAVEADRLLLDLGQPVGAAAEVTVEQPVIVPLLGEIRARMRAARLLARQRGG